MIGVYKITSPTFKVYIGQSWDIEKRFSDYKKLNCKGQTHLFNSFKKYGFDNHEIEIIYKPRKPTQEKLDDYEISQIKKYRSMECSLNIRDGGSRGKIAEQSKKKMRKVLKGRKAWNKGKALSNDHRNNLSKSKKGKGIGEDNSQFGKIRSEEHRNNLSKSLKGRVAWNKGIPMPEEQKIKVSKSRKGKCMGNKHTLGKIPWNKGKKFKK